MESADDTQDQALLSAVAVGSGLVRCGLCWRSSRRNGSELAQIHSARSPRSAAKSIIEDALVVFL
jgi:hypothetical protein